MKVALLTCEKFPELYHTDQFLIPELAKHGIIAAPAIWDDTTMDWSKFDYLIFRNTWDYYEKAVQFNNWLDAIQALGVKTLNAIETIQRNKHKFYLRDLEKQGVKILPTIFIDKTPDLDLVSMIPAGWIKAVLKPAYSAGSYLTEVFDVSQIQQINRQYQSIASQKELLLQKFMPEIISEGETSFIFFNKKFSHCVNKKPAQGDFRVQIQYGGSYVSVNPDSELLHQAQAIVNTFGEKLLYARVDGIIIDNKLHLMEIECIEPDLYFNLSADAQKNFVNAILELIQ
ncbi:ATP-grasp domain-containing protein [Flavobacterium sp.]